MLIRILTSGHTFEKKKLTKFPYVIRFTKMNYFSLMATSSNWNPFVYFIFLFFFNWSRKLNSINVSLGCNFVWYNWRKIVLIKWNFENFEFGRMCSNNSTLVLTCTGGRKVHLPRPSAAGYGQKVHPFLVVYQQLLVRRTCFNRASSLASSTHTSYRA